MEEKIDAVLKMQAPKKLKELQGFVGCVNYYRDMWPQRSHILAPLTDKTGAGKNKKLLNGRLKCKRHLIK